MHGTTVERPRCPWMAVQERAACLRKTPQSHRVIIEFGVTPSVWPPASRDPAADPLTCTAAMRGLVDVEKSKDA
eukprot:11568455-Alexandrium_andersonii.AAC.1